MCERRKALIWTAGEGGRPEEGGSACLPAGGWGWCHTPWRLPGHPVTGHPRTTLTWVPIPPQSLRDIWPDRCQAQIKNQFVSLLLSLITRSLAEGFLQRKLAPSQTLGLMDMWRNPFLCAFLLFHPNLSRNLLPPVPPAPACACMPRSGHPLPPLNPPPPGSQEQALTTTLPMDGWHPRPFLFPTLPPPCLHHGGSPTSSRPAPPQTPAQPVSPLSTLSLPPGSWPTSMSMG